MDWEYIDFVFKLDVFGYKFSIPDDALDKPYCVVDGDGNSVNQVN
jgi:hypothetical protein